MVPPIIIKEQKSSWKRVSIDYLSSMADPLPRHRVDKTVKILHPGFQKNSGNSLRPLKKAGARRYRLQAEYESKGPKAAEFQRWL